MIDFGNLIASIKNDEVEENMVEKKLTTSLLLEKGYFPAQLIPSFTTKGLAGNIDKIKIELESKKIKIRNQKDPNIILKIYDTPTYSKCIKFYSPKTKKFRRQFLIPNPLHQVLLCLFIGDKNDEIANFCNESKFSLTRLEVDSTERRAISNPFEKLSEAKVLRGVFSKYLLKIDISRFYHTIYTHSIPWAFHTKEIAKSDRGDNLIGNALDILVRNTQDGQTLGIPVGPDTSDIISEIIVSAFDKEIQTDFPEVQGFRYRDDYYLYFDTNIKAEECLKYIEKNLKKYELDLNYEKTRVEKLPIEIDSLWVSEIYNTPFDDTKQSIYNYFSKTYRLMKEFPDVNVLKYSLKKLRGISIDENWGIYEALLLNTIIIDTTITPVVLDILYRNRTRENFDRNKIKEALNKIIKYHSTFDYTFEITWALWGLKLFSLELDVNSAKELLKIRNPLIILVLLDLKSKSLIEGEIDVSELKQYMIKNELYTENWILVYEAYRKGWLPSSSGKDFIENEPFFGILKKLNISFYDDSIYNEEYEIYDWDVDNYNEEAIKFWNDELR